MRKEKKTEPKRTTPLPVNKTLSRGKGRSFAAITLEEGQWAN